MAELPLDPQLSKMVVASPGYKYGHAPRSLCSQHTATALLSSR